MGAAEKLDDKKEKRSAAEMFAIVPATWVRPALLMPLFGISSEAARKNKDRGFWLEDVHWKKDPQGNMVYNWRAIDEWNASQ